MGIFYTKVVNQCFLAGEKGQRIVLAWAAHLCFELFVQTILCQVYEKKGEGT